MGKLITTLQHSDPMIMRIQDGFAHVVNPLLKAWYSKFNIPGDCSASIIEKRITLADDWIAATLYNSWVNYGGQWPIAAYRIKNGNIEVKGAVKNGNIVGSIYRLPTRYLPIESNSLPAASADGVESGKLNFFGPGGVSPGYIYAYAPCTNVFVSIFFAVPALDPTPVPNSIFPLTFPHGLTPGKTVTTVLLADAIDTTSLAHVSSSCSWEVYGADHIKIIDLPGLFPLRTYDLSFLILGG